MNKRISHLIGFIFLISARLQTLITTKSAIKNKHIVTQTLTSAQIKYEKNAQKKRNTGKSIEKSSSHRSVTEITDFANQYDRSAKCCVYLGNNDGGDHDNDGDGDGGEGDE